MWTFGPWQKYALYFGPFLYRYIFAAVVIFKKKLYMSLSGLTLRCMIILLLNNCIFLICLSMLLATPTSSWINISFDSTVVAACLSVFSFIWESMKSIEFI